MPPSVKISGSLPHPLDVNHRCVLYCVDAMILPMRHVKRILLVIYIQITSFAFWVLLFTPVLQLRETCSNKKS